MLNNNVAQLEMNISRSKELVAMGEALVRLMANRDFKQVIDVGYFEQEAIRLVHLKADPNMQSAESQRNILMQMDAIGSLNQYLQLVDFRAAMAHKAIAADEEARDEILAEGL